MPGLPGIADKQRGKDRPEISPEARQLSAIEARPDFQEAVRLLFANKRWLNELQLQFCRIPAPTFFEEKRADWFVQQFAGLGFAARKDKAGNVVACRDSSFAGPFTALTAHLDTVLAPRSDEEVSVAPDGCLRGPGVSDNGAGLAALLGVARLLAQVPGLAPNPHSILLIANVGEEGEGNLSGMRYLCRPSSLASRIASFLILDGPNVDHITCEALASRRFEISFTGPGGHSWSDYGMANPVHALSRMIALFAENRLNGSDREPRSSYNFGWIEGGSTVNSIPTSARAKLDIRSECPERMDELAGLLSSAIERARDLENDRSNGGKVIARVREIGSRPGGRLEESSAILRAVRAVDTHLGIRSHLDCASTDANVPLSQGRPALSIGAGGQGGGAHTPAEWYSPDGREFGLKRILLTLLLLSGETGG